MFKKIKNTKTKIIIIASVVALFFVSSTVYVVISNIQLNKKITDLTYHVLKINYKLSLFELKNDDSWQPILKDKTGLDVKIPDGWSVDSSLIKGMNDITESNYKFKIVFNIGGEYTFEDFTNEMFEQAKKIAQDCYDSDVESWKDRYYVVNNFSETTYGNIYYDQKDANESGMSTRHKIKILQENNQVILEVDMF